MNIKVSYENSNNKTLCFRHAVEAVNKGEHIETRAEDDSNLGESGAWWIGGCSECCKDSENDEIPGD